jgi:hypothetical protein
MHTNVRVCNLQPEKEAEILFHLTAIVIAVLIKLFFLIPDL